MTINTNEFGLDPSESIDDEFMDPHDKAALDSTEDAANAGVNTIVGEGAAAAPAAPPAPAPAPATAGTEEDEGPDADDDQDDDFKTAALAAGKDVTDAVIKRETPAAPAPAPAADPAAAPAPAADAAATPAPPAAPAITLLTDIPEIAVPVFQPKAPADAKEQIAAERTRKAEAHEKMMNGDMEPAEYRVIENEVDDKVQDLRDALTTDRTRAELVNEQAGAAFDKVHNAAATVLKSHGIDLANVAELKKFHQLVNMHAQEVAEEGIEDGTNLLASRLTVDRAARTMLALRGIAVAAGTVVKPAAAPAPKASTPAPPPRVPDLSKLPPSIAAAPVAAATTVDGDEFGALDALNDPDEIEKRIAGMSEDQQARYLAR